MVDFILNMIGTYGYFGMFLCMILEAVIIIIPSEFILATGGILASSGIFTFFGAFISGLLGSVFCAIIIYFFGYIGGYSFIEKYGKYFFMKKDEIQKTDSWFSKYGMIGALVGRNIPIIRTLISFPIGVMRLSFFKFVIYTTIGSIPWTFVFVYMGYTLGNNWVSINNYISRLKMPIIFLILILIIVIVIKKIRSNMLKR